MGYAKLNFSVAQTNTQALYDIVRVVTGQATSTANLTYASSLYSEIVNTLGENWTIDYGPIDPSTASYVLSSPCVTAGKTHLVNMVAQTVSSDRASGTFAAAGNENVVAFRTISAATSNVSVSNPTWYSTATTTGSRYNQAIGINSSNTDIYVSWSRYHILLFGLTHPVNNDTGFLGSFEYPENSLTQFTGTAPVLQYNLNHNLGAFLSNVTPSSLTTTTATLFQGLNIHTPTNNTTNAVYNLGNTGFGTIRQNECEPVVALDANANNIYPFVPLYWSLPSQGIPLINISYYSKFYRVYKNIGQTGTVLNVGADQYAYLNINATGLAETSGVSAVVVRKA